METLKALYYNVLWSTSDLFSIAADLDIGISKIDNKNLLRFSDMASVLAPNGDRNFVDIHRQDRPIYVWKNGTDLMNPDYSAPSEFLKGFDYSMYFSGHGFNPKSAADYAASLKANGWFGMSWLPWDTTVAYDESTKQYWSFHGNDANGQQNNELVLNPLSRTTLMLKGQTIATVGVSAYAIWYVYTKYLRRQS